MFASPRAGSSALTTCTILAIVASAASAGALLAAWHEADVRKPAGEPTSAKFSAVLETAEWGNTRSFWESRTKGGASQTGGAAAATQSGPASGGAWKAERSNLGGAGLGAIGHQVGNGSLGASGVGRAGVYRTVCVRLCDGFYFPIKAATTSATFEDDEQTCRSSCTSPARLFVYPTDTGSPEEMTDTAGRPYAKLATAFLYRTSYDATCTCRPHAWETAATDRHKLYAGEAKAGRIKSAAERKAMLAELQPLRKKIAEDERAARKAGELQGREILASLARIQAPGLIQRVSTSANSGARGWSTAGSTSWHEQPDGIMRLGGPRPTTKTSSGSRKYQRR